MKIRLWPDGTFQPLDEEPYPFMSDDYTIRETGWCDNCGAEIIPHYGEPFASCDCCDREWH